MNRVRLMVPGPKIKKYVLILQEQLKIVGFPFQKSGISVMVTRPNSTFYFETETENWRPASELQTDSTFFWIRKNQKHSIWH